VCEGSEATDMRAWLTGWINLPLPLDLLDLRTLRHLWADL